ncbi:MAG: hypothetical protein ABI597_11850 [Gammaproteobacteria bacterium]
MQLIVQQSCSNRAKLLNYDYNQLVIPILMQGENHHADQCSIVLKIAIISSRVF